MYYLMQFSETKALGDAVRFGYAFLFASVFGMFDPLSAYIFTKSGADVADPPVRSGTRLYNNRKLVSGRPRRLWLRRSPEFYTRVSAKRERVFALLTCRSFSVSALLFRGFPTELQRNAELVRVVDAAPAPLALSCHPTIGSGRR